MIIVVDLEKMELFLMSGVLLKWCIWIVVVKFFIGFNEIFVLKIFLIVWGILFMLVGVFLNFVFVNVVFVLNVIYFVGC